MFDGDVKRARAHAGRHGDVHVHLLQGLVPLVHHAAFVFERVPARRGELVTHGSVGVSFALALPGVRERDFRALLP